MKKENIKIGQRIIFICSCPDSFCKKVNKMTGTVISVKEHWRGAYVQFDNKNPQWMCMHYEIEEAP
jgi:hypothetical protein